MTPDDETLPNTPSGELPDDAGTDAQVPESLKKLGDYELVRFIGAGAMGEVYLARQVRLNQRCAVKVLPEELSHSAGFERRFASEGRALAILEDIHIVRVLNAGEDKGRHFLTMEYVDGGSMDEYVATKGGRLQEAEVRQFLSEVLAGLAYAHKKKIIHRDLKPANILRTKDGHYKISDFGLALVAGEQYMQTVMQKSLVASVTASEAASRLAPDATLLHPSNPDEDATIAAANPGLPKGKASEDLTLTESQVRNRTSRRTSSASDAAALVGTIDYISPEVRSGKPADARSDIFAVGVMAYQLLTGRKPLGHARAPSKIVPELSTGWDEWVFRCMEAEPSERFQSVDEALAALPGKKASGHRGLMAACVVAVLLLAVALVFLFAKSGGTEGSTSPVAVNVDGTSPASTTAEAAPAPMQEPAEPPQPPPPVTEPERPVPATGNAVITVIPGDASVRLDSAEAQKSPAVFSDIEAGEHILLITRDGYAPISTHLMIEAGKINVPDVFRLSRLSGTLAITSVPGGLDWKILSAPDDASISRSGTTPATLEQAPEGEYVVEFSRRGENAVRTTVRVAKAQTTTASAQIRAALSRLVVNSIPSGAEVHDGENHFLGVTPLNAGDVPAGRYELFLHKPGYETARVSGVLQEGSTLRLEATLTAAGRVMTPAPSSASYTVTQQRPEVPRMADEPELPLPGPDDVFISVRPGVRIQSVKQAVELSLISDGWKIETSEVGSVRAIHKLSRTWFGRVAKLGNVSDAVFDIRYNTRGILIRDLTTDEDNERVNKKWAARLRKLIEGNLRRAR